METNTSPLGYAEEQALKALIARPIGLIGGNITCYHLVETDAAMKLVARGLARVVEGPSEPRFYPV